MTSASASTSRPSSDERRPKSLGYSTSDEVVLYVRIPGSLKNRIVNHVRSLDTSLAHWVAVTLDRAVREGRGLPEPPRSEYPLPSQIDVLRSYLTEEPLIMPCGRVGSCSGYEGKTSRMGDGSYCDECGIRVG